MRLDPDDVAALARALDLTIPPEDLANVARRLSMTLTAMARIEASLGPAMDRVDPIPPVDTGPALLRWEDLVDPPPSEPTDTRPERRPVR